MVKNGKKDATAKSAAQNVEKLPAYMAPDWEKAILLFGGITLVIAFAWTIPELIGFYFGLSGFILGWIMLFLIVAWLVYSVWAPRNITWTRMLEGQGKYVLFLGERYKAIITYNGRVLLNGRKIVNLKDLKPVHEKEKNDQGLIDELIKLGLAEHDKYNSLVSAEKHYFGGLRFVGIWPFFTVHVWEFFEWEGVDNKGNPVLNKKQWTDHINLKNYEYNFNIDGLLDKNNVPLVFAASIYARVFDPWVAIFENTNFLNETLQVLRSEINHIVRQFSYDVLNKTTPPKKEEEGQDLPDNSTDSQQLDEILGGEEELGSRLFKRIRKEGTLREIMERFGEDVFGIKIRNFNPTQDYLEATTLPYIAEQEGRANLTRAEYDAKVRAMEIGGAYIGILAIETGRTLNDIKKDMAEDYGLFVAKYQKAIIETNKKIAQQMSIDGKALVHILASGQSSSNTSGSNGVPPKINEELVAMIAVILKLLSMPQAGPGQQSTTPAKTSEGGEKRKMTPEENLAEMEGFLKE